jgi:non-ribosomal peptide synthetase component E (peptide arylation enzyme)
MQMIWHLADVFETVAALVPDQLALIDGRTRRTWREYEDRSARLAAALVARAIVPACHARRLRAILPRQTSLAAMLPSSAK